MLKKLFAILTTGAVLFAGNALTAEAFENNNDLTPCGYTDEMPVVTDGSTVLTIGTVKTSPKELEENDYIVKVPVTLTGTKFYELGFGAAYNPDELQIDTVIGGDTVIDALMKGYPAVAVPATNNTKGIVWCGVTLILTTGNECFNEGNVIYLDFKVNKNAKPGDVYTITNLDNNAAYQIPGKPVEYQMVTPAGTEDHITSERENGAVIITNNPIQPELMTVGDIDLDNSISMADVIHVSKYTTGAVELNEHAMFNADCYADGVIDSRDLDTMAMYMKGEIDSLPLIPEAA